MSPSYGLLFCLQTTDQNIPDEYRCQYSQQTTADQIQQRAKTISKQNSSQERQGVPT